MNLQTLTLEEFHRLPLVVEGESKEVRYLGGGEVVVRLKPTIYSFTHNRAGVIDGSDLIRLQAIRALLPMLRAAGIDHSYREVTDLWIRSVLVLQPEVAGAPRPFRPSDLSEDGVAKLPKVPPVEVVVKRVHSGTPKHRYYQMDRYQVRASHPTLAGAKVTTDQAYPEPFVRFDWRNPMTNANGTRLADEVLPEPMANWYIDVPAATKTALKTFRVLDDFLRQRGLELWDICFFITEDGQMQFGEISPDCLRVRAADGSALDKDVWRHGGSSASVTDKWRAFTKLIQEEL